MSQPRNAYKRQRQQTRTARHERKRRAVRHAYKPRTMPKMQRQAVSRQPQRGLPKLVQQAIGRMAERARVLSLPREAQQEAA